MTLDGYAAQSAKAALTPHRLDRRNPRHDDVVIEILYCGVPHSDCITPALDWGRDTCPMAPGHETIGRAPIKEAHERMLKCEVKYRLAIDMASLKV